MEQDQNTPLFGLSIDGNSKSFLAESAKWGKFLAIMGFIGCAFIIIAGIFVATLSSQFNSVNSTLGGYGSASSMRAFGPVLGVVYILGALIYFFPCLYLLRFSNYMKAALASDDQSTLTAAFQNLKSMFKFVGILTIIILSLYLLLFVLGGLTAAFR